jgi:DNA-binding response OmpR family regulator
MGCQNVSLLRFKKQIRSASRFLYTTDDLSRSARARITPPGEIRHFTDKKRSLEVSLQLLYSYLHMQKILCVDDAPDVLLMFENIFRGYDYSLASSLRQAAGLVERSKYSVILLDVELPDGTGFDLMTSGTDKLNGAQVIFLTGRSDIGSKASAFSLGADDYVVKPFDPAELKFRVDAKLRKAALESNQRSIVRVGQLICNMDEQTVLRANTGEALDLTFIEFKIFRLFAGAQNKVFSRAEILDRVWGHSVSVTDRVVDVHISNLRKKIAGHGASIEAVVGAGYRISGDDLTVA